jgi:hypothetical protein
MGQVLGILYEGRSDWEPSHRPGGIRGAMDWLPYTGRKTPSEDVIGDG